MTILSKSLLALGLLLLIHATYSAHEHHTLLTTPTSSTTIASTTLPPDIILEILLSTLILTFGLVLGSAAFRPIIWREWAGKIEREGGMGNPFLGLGEGGKGSFLDIRARRKEFAEWVKEQGTGGKGE